jgi:hypothetical protein
MQAKHWLLSALRRGFGEQGKRTPPQRKHIEKSLERWLKTLFSSCCETSGAGDVSARFHRCIGSIDNPLYWR